MNPVVRELSKAKSRLAHQRREVEESSFSKGDRSEMILAIDAQIDAIQADMDRILTEERANIVADPNGVSVNIQGTVAAANSSAVPIGG